jgi:ribA/ribD-fused uncharacterized protein
MMETPEIVTPFYSGVFSQWSRSPFTLDGHTFQNAEQWMMWNKAQLFEDEKTAAAILATNNPKQIKAWGRKVTPFDEVLWAQHREDIVFKGNLAKFSQNKTLWEQLNKTQGTLVECSPTDLIWGVGLKLNDPRVQYRSKWRGKNLLGLILTRVRAQLRLRIASLTDLYGPDQTASDDPFGAPIPYAYE